jgi:hypothetical protein
MGIIKDIDLADGTNAVVQVNKEYTGRLRASLSFDGKTTNVGIWLSFAELKAYAAMLEQAVYEAQQLQQKQGGTDEQPKS